MTEIDQIGEFGLIDRLTADIRHVNASTIKGVGDDAAILSPTEGFRTLVTTDLLLEGIHFDLTYVPLQHLGYKAAQVNFSDIYAMGGEPRQITVSLGISKRFSVEAIDMLYAGLLAACREHNVDLVGGDTSASMTGLTISITCIGEARPEDIVTREGARDTDLICVTGDLGAAYMGLQLLEREKTVYRQQLKEWQEAARARRSAMQSIANGQNIASGDNNEGRKIVNESNDSGGVIVDDRNNDDRDMVNDGDAMNNKDIANDADMPSFSPDFAGREYILQRQLHPEARRDVIFALRTAGIHPTAMMDISDGLSSELMHICKASGCGCRIYEERIPLDYQTVVMAEELNMNVITAALNGGEDYELLFTVPLAAHEQIQSIPDVKVIGHVTKPDLGQILVARDGAEFTLKAQGWHHKMSS